MACPEAGHPLFSPEKGTGYPDTPEPDLYILRETGRFPNPMKLIFPQNAGTNPACRAEGPRGPIHA